MRIAISAVVFLSVILISATLAAQELPAPAGPTPSPAPGGTLPTAPSGPSAEATPPTTGPSPIPGTVPGAAPPVGVSPTTGAVSGDEIIPFTYDNMPLATIIELVAKRTGRNFLLQMPISGSITIHCPKGIRASQAFDILGVILDSLGFTMVVSDDPPLILVTQKRNTGPAVTDVKVSEEGAGLEKKRELATFIVVLKYVSVDDMQKVLANFKSSTCIMTAYQAGNFLILKDDEASLKYLMEIIDKIDVPGTGTKVTMVQLKYADASETATLLSELLAAREGARVTPAAAVPRPTPPTPGRPTAPQPTSIAPTIVGAAAPLKLIPEARTNRLVILASEKDTEYILKLVAQIDVEPLEDMYPVRTYIAQYQNADDLADTLASFVTGQPRQRTTGRTATGLTQQRARTGARTVGQPTTAGPTAAAQRAAVAGGTEEGFFLADPATNIVLIQAPPQKLDMYMELLRKLDQPQKQVLIEVWVVEISSNSQLDIGVEFQPAEPPPGAMTGPVQDALFGGTNFGLGLVDLMDSGSFPTSGISLGLRSLTNTAIDVGGKTYYIPSFDTFIRALRQDTAFNILSSPKLLTLNNEPASVDVSDEISIEESTYSSYGGVTPDTGVPAGALSTYQRTNVGISLQITPQINSENSVIMDVDLVVGSIAGVEDLSQVGVRPVIANRSTVTKVRVDNGRTIVISGLRRSDKTTTISRVPLLGQIPILGLLFSHRKTATVNTNLLIFITPHIVSDTLDMLEITNAIKSQDLERERQRFQIQTNTGKPRREKKKSSSEWEWKK